MIEFTGKGNVGLLPHFLSESSKDDAVTQIGRNYAHGGGWNDFTGFKLQKDDDRYGLKYPGDRPMREIARGRLRDELVVLFEYDWVAVIQPDETFRIARID